MPADKMSPERIELLLERALYGRLGTAGAEFPYVVPLCFLYHKERLYFHSRLTGKKMGELKANPRVCMQIDEISGLIKSSLPCDFNVAYESVIVQGTAKIVEDGNLKNEVLLLLAQKYAGEQKLEPMKADEIKGTALVQIAIDNIHGKAKSS